MTSLRAALYLLPALVVLSAPAAPVAISNHSFEAQMLAPDTFNTAAPPPGWSSFGSLNFGWRAIGAVNPNTTLLYFDAVPAGSNLGVVFLGPTFSNIPSGLHQTLSTTLQGRTVYTLSVAVGNMAYVATPPHNAYNFNGFPGYRIELLAGGHVVAADHNTLLPAEGRFLTSVVQAATSSTHTNIGLPLGIRLINLDAAAGIEVNFDDVRLEADPRPDPALALSGAPEGALRIDFTEALQASDDLAVWTNVAPLPASPWLHAPVQEHRFFRAAE